ncbi:MAG: hypothetical protein ABW076_03145 [Candidatus Thiodiazotropha sp.]
MNHSQWNPQTSSGSWADPDNWTPSGVPTGNACFGAATQTGVSFKSTGQAQVAEITFIEDAASYTLTFGPSASPVLNITGSGVCNRSGKLQSFIVAATSRGYHDPQLRFDHSASAGGDDIFYCAGPESESAYGGGVISFCDQSSAGSASFKAWTGAAAPPEHNTVGGEISFSDSATADRARFIIYGSLGADGDTFGNVVFHDSASASQANFTNVGGTVPGGDGGNTQFYGHSDAGTATFYNWGGNHAKANGGDVAFDANADAGHGYFYNYAAKAANAYGGVTSFNNNPPHTTPGGASAGQGMYFNFGARQGEQGGGGHMEFSAKYGSPTASEATIVNYGSTAPHKSSAGHTLFSMNLPGNYAPNAGKARIYNHPAVGERGAAGYTEFSVYGSDDSHGMGPSGGNATLLNLGGTAQGEAGGYTIFSATSSADQATLIAYGGTHGGEGGRILFHDQACGGESRVQLFGNAVLDISGHAEGVSIAALEMTGGVIGIRLGARTSSLSVSGGIKLNANQVAFEFQTSKDEPLAFNTSYTILSSPNMQAFSAQQFSANPLEGVTPTFSILANELQVTFKKA